VVPDRSRHRLLEPASPVIGAGNRQRGGRYPAAGLGPADVLSPRERR
jgi:hypothetical protein